ncbi:hypothetical protein ACIBO9_28395 [Streptomyces prunicolor]|uniref:hypothetical protein n=1 Tax=Streptomyces prunicolor TaxID=67348 RepID=UPI0037CD7815
MGKASRRRRDHRLGQSRPRPLALAFCDVDFERGSRAHGRGVAPAPPEGWVIGRAGLVHAEWNGEELRITGDELIDGPRPASRLINALHGKQLVIGHGILTADLRAAAMVTKVPDSLLKRTIDMLAFAHRIRGKRYPTGCGLSALAKANLRNPRTKPAYPSSAAGLRPGGGKHGMSPERGDNDPREDALLVARLWQTVITTRALAWGAGSSSWTDYHGNTRPGAPAGAAALSDDNIAELTGHHPHIEAVEWAQRVREEGRVMRPTDFDHMASRLALHWAKDLPAPQQVRELADTLQQAGQIPADRHMGTEELLTAIQCLGPRQNLDVRERILSDKRLTKLLRENLSIRLWEITHPEWMKTFWDTRKLARTTAIGELRLSHLKLEQRQIRGHVLDAMDTSGPAG